MIGTYSNSTLEFTKLSSTPSWLISVILSEFLQVVLLTSRYLDANLHNRVSEEKEEQDSQSVVCTIKLQISGDQADTVVIVNSFLLL